MGRRERSVIRRPARSGSAAVRFGAAALAVAALFALLPGSGAAQPVRGRVLEGLSVRSRGARWEIEIRFSVPIRVLRHAPRERGDFLQVFVEPLQVGSADVGAFQRGESLLPPRGSDAPLTEVRYRGDEPGRPLLELRFAREVRFDVRGGDDFRSVVIAVRRDDVAGYAVQLGSPPEQGPVPPLPDLPALRGRRVYVATISEGGRTWQRLRLGFFSERSEAEAAAAQLDAAFPGALVVEVTRREIQRSEQSALTPAPAPPPGGEAPPAGVPDRTAELMDEARRAMTGGEYSKAILIYTKVLSLPESPHSAEAQELLGLARERSGQLAHAKAEYEEYLRRYPEGEAAARVRQRLAALITARAPERERLPEEGEAEPAARPQLDTFGSLFASYRRESLFLEEEDDQTEDVLADSSLFTDLFLESRLSGERYSARTQLSGGYFYDFLGSGSNGVHLASAFLEGNATEIGLSGSLGRRSQSTGGVLGRFDGGRVSKRLGTRWETSLYSGFPVDSPTEYEVDTDRYFLGGSLQREHIFEVLDAEVFAIHQMVGDSTDRSAVGAELRYVQGGRSLFAYLDYDVYFTSLNIAQLSGNAQVTQRGFVHLLADYRNAPILTTSNALQGQLVGSFGDLDELFSSSELQALAEDRTAQSLFLNLGGSYSLRENLQLAADANASHLSGTDESAGVPAFDGTGFEYSYSTQVIANSLLRSGDVGIAGLRYLDGSAYDAAALSLSSRQPLSESLRAEPRFLTEYRFRKSGIGDELLLRPGLGFEYRRWKLDLDLEGGAEWLRREGDSDELGWYGLVGVRLDY
jgi:hypothetical protein